MALPADPSPPTLHYVGAQDLCDKLGRDKYTAIFDDNNDGAPDPTPVRRHLLDSESFAEGVFRAAGYSIKVVREKRPSQAVRLVLEHAEAMAAIRHPEIMRIDGDKAFDRVLKEAMLYQKKALRLDLDDDDPAPANVGGSVGKIGSSVVEPPPSFFADLGDYPGGNRYG